MTDELPADDITALQKTLVARIDAMLAVAALLHRAVAARHTEPRASAPLWMDHAQAVLDYKDAIIAVQVADDLAHPQPGRSAARWRRAEALIEEWHLLFRLPRGKDDPEPWERPEGAAIARELAFLHDVERETAYALGWPVWQERQHFEFIDPADGVLKSGDVRSLDLDAGTVLAGAVWPYNESGGTGYDYMCPTQLHDDVVPIAAIVAGEAEHHRRWDADCAARRTEVAAATEQAAAKAATKAARKKKQPEPALTFDAIPTAE